MDRTEHMTAHPYYLYGIADERERIAKAMEAFRNACFCGNCFNGIWDLMEAAIKGETK